MVDAADHDKLDQTKNELHSLLEKPQLVGIPVSLFLKFHLIYSSLLVEKHLICIDGKSWFVSWSL